MHPYELQSDGSIRLGKAALIVVDVENEFCHPAGTIFLGRRVIEPITLLRRLIGRANEHDCSVVYVRSVRSPDALEYRLFDRRPALLEGSWAVEFVEGVEPRASDPIVEKRSHDPFNNTTFEQTLVERGIRPETHALLVAGVATHGCVLCTVIGLSVRAFSVLLLADCTASGTKREEQLAFDLLRTNAYSHNVRIVSSPAIEFPGEASARSRIETTSAAS